MKYSNKKVSPGRKESPAKLFPPFGTSGPRRVSEQVTDRWEAGIENAKRTSTDKSLHELRIKEGEGGGGRR